MAASPPLKQRNRLHRNILHIQVLTLLLAQRPIRHSRRRRIHHLAWRNKCFGNGIRSLKRKHIGKQSQN